MNPIDPLGQVARTLAPGVEARPMHGDALTVVKVELAPGASVPTHSHPHEQAAVVLSGELLLTVDGVEHPVEAGMTTFIPSGVEHSARSEVKTVVLDIFTPVREDLR